jgi:hypothetical protein
MTNGARGFLVTMKEKSNVRWGFVEDPAGSDGGRVYAVVDYPCDGYEFSARLLGDVPTFVGEDGNGWLLCRIHLFTVH